MKKIKIISIVILTSFIVLLGQEHPSLGKIPDIDLKLLNGKKTNHKTIFFTRITIEV